MAPLSAIGKGSRFEIPLEPNSPQSIKVWDLAYSISVPNPFDWSVMENLVVVYAPFPLLSPKKHHFVRT